MSHRSIQDISAELRAHPDVTAVIVWVEEDARGVGHDPDLVPWDDVEDAGIQAGWSVIEWHAPPED